ncbi:hydrolase [Acinetobacter baumannii]|uniref:hydrolase n=1 Tax=Acinetobacter baumannii TaxID=470 RepID=UPI000DE7AB79|nr:hydrolase [Acinetobacter baumannii]MDC4882753.1 hydrolase [Acinetobacter baumannii]MDC4890031.1 hydrolase [Acinetobacter baumannii]MDC4904243.1 hydrolase [Acinetobacter baumannii]MDC4912091.1 hydrolase [Acinetobacter baumannii]MDC4930315.1 hydrolase [Acinetobacter baumannii]
MKLQNKILLITGWGVGVEPLQSLKLGLMKAGYDTQLINIFNVLDSDFHEQLNFLTDIDVVVGWSLGGQLATYLVDFFYKQTGQTKTLITLASNPCFVANTSWHTAMSADVFSQFNASFLQNPQATLKRFYYLITLGSSQAKQDWFSVQNIANPPSNNLLLEGLQMLEQLNLVDNLKTYSGRQLHLFAEQDNVIPCKIIENFKDIATENMDYKLLKDATHAFPYLQVERTIEEICQFLTIHQQSS